MPKPDPPQPDDYEVLDRYLQAVFQLLEGFVDVDQAQQTLSSYLEFHADHQLPPQLIEMLVLLFFEKCSKEFLPG